MATRSILVPPKLKRGDLIGIVAPAGSLIEPAKLDRGVRYLECAGYRVKVGPNVGKVRGYLAGTDGERLHDLHAMFADSEVKAIFCARGGYGTPRLLPLLDYDLIARHPKILVGFSDITALQLALWQKCRLVTFHGPMVSADFSHELDSLTEESFWNLVTADRPFGTVSWGQQPVKSSSPGDGTGRLIGGNLSLVASLVGTPYLPSLERALLFVEDISEEPYRVDRLFTQLQNAGLLQSLSGLLLGQFVQCEAKLNSKPSLSLDEVIGEIVTRLKKPILANLPFGHVRTKVTFPIGIRARLEADQGRLTLLEAAVS